MTDTSNQNPVQPQSDNPFFRPAANDPAQVITPDPMMPAQSSPPASTVPDPLASLQNTNPAMDTTVPSTPPIDNSSLPSMPAMQDVTASPINAPAPMVDPVGLNTQTNEVPEPKVLEPMSPTGLDNSLNASIPSGAPVSETQAAPVSEDMNSVSTMPAASSSSVEETLPGAAPVMPPVESPNLSAVNVEQAPAESAPVVSSMPSLSGTIDAPLETPKETLPDLNTLSTSLPDLNAEVKPLESNVSNTGPVIDSSNLVQPVAPEAPGMEPVSLGTDLNLPVAEPVATSQPEITADPAPAQTEAVPMAGPITEASPTLPPLEPLVQSETQDNAMNVETQVVTPLAQEVTPTVANETPQNTNEPTPTAEAAPAAGKMKNLVLLLGVLVVGIMALVLGIIVASTQ
jgi:hypothetical protein